MEDLIFKNGYGVAIKKCCASCQHKQYDNKNRICMIGQGIVSPSFHCGSWVLANGLENAGKGTGSVKRIGYLRACLNAMEEDKKLFELYGNAHKKKPLSLIRAEYVKEHLTIYAIKP